MAAKKKSTHSSPSPSRRFRFNEVLFFVRVTPPPMTNERTTLLLFFFFSLFFPGCCVGGIIRDELVCVAKSLSFFLSFLAFCDKNDR